MNLEPRTSNLEPPMGLPALAGAVGRWLLGVGCFLLISLVRLYRWTLSPAKTFLCGPLAQCRFTPSCSAYALESLRTHGAVNGSWLAMKRVCRCHPWGDCGQDPVPKAESGKRKAENRWVPARGC